MADRRLPWALGIFIEIVPHPRIKIFRHGYSIGRHRLDNFLDCLLNELTPREKSKSFVEPVFRGHDFPYPMLRQLAFDKLNELIACHRVELDALPAHQAINFFGERAVSSKPIAKLVFRGVAERYGFGVKIQRLYIGEPQTEIDNTDSILEIVPACVRTYGFADTESGDVKIVKREKWNIVFGAHTIGEHASRSHRHAFAGHDRDIKFFR